MVIRDDQAGEQPERRRRHCLERLFYELDGAGVTQVYLESRAPMQNKLDADLLAGLRAKKVVGADLRIHHPAGPTDEALWMADVVNEAHPQIDHRILADPRQRETPGPVVRQELLGFTSNPTTSLPVDERAQPGTSAMFCPVPPPAPGRLNAADGGSGSCACADVRSADEFWGRGGSLLLGPGTPLPNKHVTEGTTR